MPEIKLRYNPETEEAEVLVDEEVAFSSGKDVFKSWVDDYNEKHPVVAENNEQQSEPEQEPVVPPDYEALYNEAVAENERLKAEAEKEEVPATPTPEVEETPAE